MATGANEYKWIEERELGNGGFGSVKLFRNKETNERMAIKKCRLTVEITKRHKERWTQECAIMLRLKHRNVVSAMIVPTELERIREELPLMAMEYCAGGDLRKMLNVPENCCGLKESQVRQISGDVAAGLEYLHDNRIIHRDLKPENVVIQNQANELIYKLIDLGYAKDLEQGSLCTSFVGTMQYLAPELFFSGDYTRTVDYWSFGLLIFECITGNRPFFPNVPPIKWQNDVSRKSNTDICAFFDDKGQVAFSSNIPPPHQLCRITLAYYEQWLRTMLRWDPVTRGGYHKDKRSDCFVLLDKLLSVKIMRIFCPSRNELFSYPVPSDQTLLQEVMFVAENETKIRIQDQLLLLENGSVPDYKKPALVYLQNEDDAMPPGETVLYLFPRAEFQRPNVFNVPVPQAVLQMIKEPKTVMPYPDKKKAWGQSAFFAQLIVENYSLISKAFKVAMLALLIEDTALHASKDKFMQDYLYVKAKTELYKHSFEFDQAKYDEQSSTGISSKKMFSKWVEMRNVIGGFADLMSECLRTQAACDEVVRNILDLQRNTHLRDENQNPHFSELRSKSDAILTFYRSIRSQNQEGAVTAPVSSNVEIQQQIVQIVQIKERKFSDIFLPLSHALRTLAELQQVTPRLQDSRNQLQRAQSKLLDYQLQRQRDIWGLLNIAVRETKNSKRQQSLTASASGGDAPPSVSGVSNGTGGGGNSMAPSMMSAYFTKMAESSVTSRLQNNESLARLESMLASIHHENGVNGSANDADDHFLDWSFLNGSS